MSPTCSQVRRRRRWRLTAVAVIPAVGLTLILSPATAEAPTVPTEPRDAPVRVATLDGVHAAEAAAVRVAPPPARPPAAPTAAVARTRQATQPFATVGEVDLIPPTPRPLLIGFHESAEPRSLVLRPTDRPGMTTLPSRGRGTGQRSAVDIAMRAGEEVRAVVSGTVVDVGTYSLYGEVGDVIIVLSPDADPTLRVRVLHVADPAARVGQRVEAGVTVVAGTARPLPFGSQIDRLTGARAPHVHVDVEPAG